MLSLDKLTDSKSIVHFDKNFVPEIDDGDVEFKPLLSTPEHASKPSVKMHDVFVVSSYVH